MAKGDVVYHRFYIEGSLIYGCAIQSSTNPDGAGWTVYQPISHSESRLHHVATEAEAIALAKALAPSCPNYREQAREHLAALTPTTPTEAK